MTIDTAMVMAAGLGTRLRPLTNNTPKPLLPFAGRSMLDRVLDHLVAGNIKRAVVNVHYLPDQIIAHLEQRKDMEIFISDERDALLDSGGGIKKALPLIARDAFITVNADAVWDDPVDAPPALTRLLEAWNPQTMETLMLLADKNSAVGFDGAGDYFADASGQLHWRGMRNAAPYVYASLAIDKAWHYANHADQKFSRKPLWDKHEANGKLHGIIHHGTWYHCSTPDDYAAVNTAMAA